MHLSREVIGRAGVAEDRAADMILNSTSWERETTGTEALRTYEEQVLDDIDGTVEALSSLRDLVACALTERKATA